MDFDGIDAVVTKGMEQFKQYKIEEAQGHHHMNLWDKPEEGDDAIVEAKLKQQLGRIPEISESTKAACREICAGIIGKNFDGLAKFVSESKTDENQEKQINSALRNLLSPYSMDVEVRRTNDGVRFLDIWAAGATGMTGSMEIYADGDSRGETDYQVERDTFYGGQFTASGEPTEPKPMLNEMSRLLIRRARN